MTTGSGREKSILVIVEKLRLLDGRFTDVILVFDFDLQDNRFDADSLKRYAAAFCDSTDRGLLFINYPSVEAYRDFDHLGDMDFLDLRIDVDGAEGDAVVSGYKRLVAERNNKFDDIARIR